MYYIIDPNCCNKVYDNEDFDIHLLKFKTKEAADIYLKYSINEIPTEIDIRKRIKEDENKNEDECNLNIFTDGACSNNGNTKAKAGIGVYFKDNDIRNVSKICPGNQTNNNAELTAILEAIKQCIGINKNITIYTDSQYSIDCYTKWSSEWIKNKWKKKDNKIPENIEVIKKGYILLQGNKNITLRYIKAHTGLSDRLSIGNDKADILAKLSIK